MDVGRDYRPRIISVTEWPLEMVIATSIQSVQS
jgi:hypothetical protein